MLRRKIDNYLLNWKNNRTTSLLVKGARQIGKTYSINRFIDNNYKYSIRINFADRKDLIEDFVLINNYEQLLLRLSLIDGKNLKPNETIIFFDEIQILYEYRDQLKKQRKLPVDSADLLTLIKPLTIDGKYRFILSGSLLGISLKDVFLYPLGYMDEIEMFPLDFEEYLWAKNVGEDVINHVKGCFSSFIDVDETINNKLLQYFREYVLIGGMPEVVNTFINNNNLSIVNEIQSQIINRYTYDIDQYITKESKKLRIREIYKAIPSELNSKNKRFISTHVVDSNYLKKDAIVDEFLWLANAGIVIPVYNVCKPDIPLAMTSERKTLKIFTNDTGLLVHMLVDTGIREKLLNNELIINYGAPYENVAAQQLFSHGFKEKIYYYNSKKHGEVDFLVEVNGEVLPIEIKSGKTNDANLYNHSALNNLLKIYKYKKAFVFGNCNVKKESDIIYQLPLYMISFVSAI